MISPPLKEEKQSATIIEGIRARKLASLSQLYAKFGSSLQQAILQWVPSEEWVRPVYVKAMANVWASKEIYTRGKKRFYPWLVLMCEGAVGEVVLTGPIDSKQGLIERFSVGISDHQYGSSAEPIGRKLRFVRKIGLNSLEEVATRLGCLPKEVSYLECQERLSWKLVEAVSVALKISLLQVLSSPGDDWIGDRYNPIGRMIKSRREKMGVRQKDLAAWLKIGVIQLSSLEKVTELPVEKLQWIAAGLSCTPGDIMREVKAPEHVEENRIIGGGDHHVGHMIALCLAILCVSRRAFVNKMGFSIGKYHSLINRATISQHELDKIAGVLEVPSSFLSLLKIMDTTPLKKHYGDHLDPIGKKIRFCRIERNMSIPQLAKALSYSDKWVEKLERLATISANKLKGIALALDMSLEELIVAGPGNATNCGTVENPVGDKIKMLRKAAGINRDDFAKAMGYSGVTQNKVERSATLPMALIEKAAAFLKVPSEKILLQEVADNKLVGGAEFHTGNNLRQIRIKNKLTQQEVAILMKLPRGRLSVLEMEKKAMLPASTVQQFAESLQVLVKDIIGNPFDQATIDQLTAYGNEALPVGQRIKVARKEKKISLLHAGQRLGLSQTAYYNLEKRSVLDKLKLMDVASALEIPLNSIIVGLPVTKPVNQKK